MPSSRAINELGILNVDAGMYPDSHSPGLYRIIS